MTSIPTSGAAPLRDALYAMSFAQRVPDAALLDDVVRRFPEHAVLLTDFAIELAMDALRGDDSAEVAETAIDVDRISPAVSRAMSRFQNRLHAERQASTPSAGRGLSPTEIVNPFASLDRRGFRDLAARLGANTVFVAKLRDRQIDAGGMSDGFRCKVADELHAPIGVVIAHFAAGQATAGRQFFKAEGKPDASERQTFEEAVRNSGLTEEQQRHLLSL
jgi:hypothetical protein